MAYLQDYEGNHRPRNDSDSDISLHSSASWANITHSAKPDQELQVLPPMNESERGPLLDRAPPDTSAGAAEVSGGFHNVLDDDPQTDNVEGTKSPAYLILLTTCMLGLQMGWSVEMAGVSPFLLSLGLSKALLALVWIAGPLSGTVVQPFVGIKSDNCRSKWGRRRPFMFGGTMATISSLLALAWTREIMAALASIFGVDLQGQLTSPAYQVWAVALIYILDFAINVVQASVRAFIIDCLPTHQQELGNAWASRIAGIGHIVAYMIGFVHLPDLFPWLGNSQFKVFVALACVIMAVTLSISCLSISEPDTRLLGAPVDGGTGLISFLTSLFRSIRTLPRQVKVVCLVQICAWIGWFPYLFYTTTYIGELYAEPYFEANPNLTESEIDDIWERATRVGTFALLTFALTTFASSVFLPMIIPPTFRPVVEPQSSDRTKSKARLNGPQPMWQRMTRKLATIFDPQRLQVPWLTLRRAWIASHLVFTTLMWLTLFVSTPTGGTILIGLVGIPWALTNWAPFAFIAAEISRRNSVNRRHRQTSVGSDPEESSSSPPSLRRQVSFSRDHDGSTDQAGVLLGIHNVAISAPQVIATLVSSAMFRALQKPRGTPGDDSVGWVLRMGGLCALAAAYFTRLISDGRPQ